MARDPLDAPLDALCSDAEHTVRVLRLRAAAHPHLRAFGVEPLDLADDLAARAAEGRAASTARRLAHLAVARAADGVEDAAREAYAFQVEAREALAVLELLNPETLALPAADLRARLRQRRPRLRSGLDQLRHALDDLGRPGHPLVAHDQGRAILLRARALEPRLAAALAEHEAALRVRRDAVAACDVAEVRLREALIAVRRLWGIARRREPDLPPLTFEYGARAVARRRTGLASNPDPAPDGPAPGTPVDPIPLAPDAPAPGAPSTPEAPCDPDPSAAD